MSYRQELHQWLRKSPTVRCPRCDKRVVLDDAAGHDQVRPLLPGAAGSVVLITSRTRLVALDDAAVIDLDTLSPAEAAAMLASLSGRPDLDPGDPAVEAIARLCGHLPLAVGMLAAQLRQHLSWTPAGMAAELAAIGDRLELLRAENRSVATAFDLSYRNLTAQQQQLFRRLGLQPGPDIDSYAAAALDGTALPDARRSLEALYDRHVITEPRSSLARWRPGTPAARSSELVITCRRPAA
jgi:hypothetical protein